MSETFRLVHVPHPLRINRRKVWDIPYTGQTLADIRSSHLPNAEDVVWSVNGVDVTEDAMQVARVRANDLVTVRTKVAGGGGGDKDILSSVIMIATVLAAGPIVGALGLTGVAAQAATAAFMFGGGMLASSVNARSFDMEPYGSAEYKESFKWNPHTLQQQGVVVGKYYGKYRLHGNAISVSTEVSEDGESEKINMVVALGRGPFESISDKRLCGQPIGNYADVSSEDKLGTVEQTALSLFSTTKAQFQPNIKVVYGTPVVYTLPDDDYDDIEVVLQCPRGVYYANNQGGLSNHSVGYTVEARVAGGSWTEIDSDSITRNETGMYQISFTVSDALIVTRGNKYEVRVSKTTEDQSSSRYGDDLYLSSVLEVFNDAFRYPRTALVGISALATDQLSGSLDFSCLAETSIVAVYDGTSWSLEYSNNPAWVIYDILTQPVITGDGDGTPYAIARYDGLNPNRIDVDKFYELASWCDDLVDDGNGSTSKRITFNGGFENATNVWDAVFKVCESARCVPVWNGTELTLAIDKASDVVGAYTCGNIIKDELEITYLPKSERAGEIEVRFRDENQDYELTPFTIYNSDAGSSRYKVTRELAGCTNQAEAWRWGEYRLKQNMHIKRRFKWKTDVDGIGFTIGDRIKFQHSVVNYGEIGSGDDPYAGGGRIISVDLSGADHKVTVDEDVSAVLDGGETYELMVKLADDTVETLDIKSVSGREYTLDGQFTGTPAGNDVYAVGIKGQVADDLRVVNFERSQWNRCTITAVDYVADTYSGDTDGPTLPAANVSSPASHTSPIVRPVNLLDLKAKVPNTTVQGPNITVPMLTNVEWNDNTPSAGSVSWASEDGETPILFTVKGVTYEITASNTSNEFIYWDANYTTEFKSSNTKTDAIGEGKYLVCWNDSGIARYMNLFSVLYSAFLYVDQLSAISANLGTITGGSITIEQSAGSDYKIRLSNGGIQVTNDGGSNWRNFLVHDGDKLVLSYDCYDSGEEIVGVGAAQNYGTMDVCEINVAGESDLVDSSTWTFMQPSQYISDSFRVAHKDREFLDIDIYVDTDSAGTSKTIEARFAVYDASDDSLIGYSGESAGLVFDGTKSGTLVTFTFSNELIVDTGASVTDEIYLKVQMRKTAGTGHVTFCGSNGVCTMAIEQVGIGQLLIKE